MRGLMIAGLFVLFLFTFGCEDTVRPADIVFPDVNVSYSQHVQPLFDQTCAFSGCHNDATRAGNLSLTSYHNLTQRPDIVFPGNPESSLLYIRISSQQLGPQMPMNRPPLNRNQQQGIRTWINEGAENN